MRHRPPLATVGLALVAALIGSVAGVAFANHQFSDVPAAQPHHDAIAELVDAGCATGFDDGTYQPGDPVTRGQVARQITRCGARVTETGASASPSSDGIPVAVSGAQVAPFPDDGYYIVTATATMTSGSDTAQCPCDVVLRIEDTAATQPLDVQRTWIPTGVTCSGTSNPCGSVTAHDVLASGDNSGAAEIEAEAVLTTAGTDVYGLAVKLIVQYVPFREPGPS